MAANPDVVEKLKAGNMKPMGAIIGAVMKAHQGPGRRQGGQQDRDGEASRLVHNAFSES